jgi:hypothetical protein
VDFADEENFAGTLPKVRAIRLIVGMRRSWNWQNKHEKGTGPAM